MNANIAYLRPLTRTSIKSLCWSIENVVEAAVFVFFKLTAVKSSLLAKPAKAATAKCDCLETETILILCHNLHKKVVRGGYSTEC